MGKTMLSIFITEEIEEFTRGPTDSEALFYFCSNQDDKRNSAVSIFRSLICQMLTKRPSLFAEIESYFDDPAKAQAALSSPHVLWSICSTLLHANRDPVFCVLDGLDECDDKSARLIVECLRQYFFPSTLNVNFQLVIVSRKVPGLEIFPHVRLDPDNNDHVSSDIENFISERVSRLQTVPGFHDIQEHVKKTLLERAEGTFLWVGFVMTELQKKVTCTQIMEALDSIPSGLPEIYSRILLRIERHDQKIVSRILRLVAMAARALTLTELASALGIRSTKYLSKEKIMLDYISLCDNMVEVIDDEAFLVHQSVRDYLLRDKPHENPILERFRIKWDDCHHEIVNICLSCIEESALRDGPIDLTDDSTYLNTPSFLRYAVVQWAEHASMLVPSKRNKAIFDRPFFAKHSRVLENWWTTFRVYRDESSRLEHDPGQDPLHMASYFGIHMWCVMLLERQRWPSGFSTHINKVNAQGDTPLSLACQNGSDDIVRSLIKKGAKAKTNNYRALKRAILYSHDSTLETLIDLGVDFNFKDQEGEPALVYAATMGSAKTVQILVRNGADVNCSKNKDGTTALIRAAGMGEKDTINLLLRMGAHIDQTNHEGETALICASRLEEEGSVRLLLEKGANSCHTDNEGCTALMQASQDGERGMIEALLSYGAKIDQKDHIGETALIMAAEAGHEQTVQLLLDSGADINLADDDGESPLRHAAENGHEAVVSLLLENGANLEQGDNDRETSLMYLAEQGNDKMVSFLLDKGSYIHQKNDHGMAALHYAARGGSVAVVKILLERGADIDLRDNDGWTPLIFAIRYKGEAMVNLLLREGANQHIGDNDGQAALWHARDIKDNGMNIVACLMSNLSM